MLHPDILRHYTYRVTECQSKPVDALADVAQYWGVKVPVLAAFLRAVDAPRADRLTLI